MDSAASSPARRSSVPTRSSGRWTTTTCAGSRSAERSTASSPSTARAKSARARGWASTRPPSVPLLQFKGETPAYDASVGHTGAGSVNLALKSGTNAFHGAASYFNRDESRSANLFASNARGTEVSTRAYNRFSGTVGGPLFKNKTFFMGSYERLQDDTVETFTTSVPTERMRNGDFSELLAAGAPRSTTRTRRGWGTAASPPIRFRATS